MRPLLAVIAVLLLASQVRGTYSIVARDAVTGELGVAVQSHWFDVGSVVPWAEAGVGAVATQSLVRVSYGPLGLELMRGGLPAPEALDALRAVDDGADLRQIAMIDAAGRVTSATGGAAIAEVSAFSEYTSTYSIACLANMMHDPGVANAMAAAFKNAPEGSDLAERMMLALEAAQQAGGDIRGMQSASILVVGGEKGDGWRGRHLDLRVADHTQPLAELRRLVTLHRAYSQMDLGDTAMEQGDFLQALVHFNAAQELNPDHVEMAFWTGVTLAKNGRADESIPFFRRALADPNAGKPKAEGGSDWAELLRRLPASGLFPDDHELIARILKDAAPSSAR